MKVGFWNLFRGVKFKVLWTMLEQGLNLLDKMIDLYLSSQGNGLHIPSLSFGWRKLNLGGWGNSGQTRPLAGPRSEGQSYWNLANHIYRQDKSIEKLLFERVVSEDF